MFRSREQVIATTDDSLRLLPEKFGKRGRQVLPALRKCIHLDSDYVECAKSVTKDFAFVGPLRICLMRNRFCHTLPVFTV